jgi:hypothetical protein
VQQIVRRALEKDPARRYQSSGEMMTHCQQVFSELNQGNVSVGGGGMMKTAFAQAPMQMQQMPPQMQQQQQQQPPQMQQQQQQYMQASPMQKTMIAQPSPFAGGQMPQQMPMQQGGLAPPQQQGFVQASPMQKTIVAGLAPPMMNGPGQMLPQQQPMMPPGGYPQQGQPASSGPNKTVLLQPSDGVVSVARTGGALQPAGGKISEGASPLFWIICLIMGVGVGVLAYVIVLQTA